MIHTLANRKMHSCAKDKQAMFGLMFAMLATMDGGGEQLVVHKRPKDDTDDEKVVEQALELSPLLDFKRARKDEHMIIGHGMCPKGHVQFYGMFCSLCGFSAHRVCGLATGNLTDEEDDEAKDEDGGDEEDDEELQSIYFECVGCNRDTRPTSSCLGCGGESWYCAKCRASNVSLLESQHRVDKLKKLFIRNQLISNPMLGLDLLTGLPAAAAMNHILKYLENMDIGRHSYCLFFMDVDNLKALNSAYTHDGANKILFDIAQVLQTYAQKVNNGEYKDESRINSLHRAWAFRCVSMWRLSANLRACVCMFSPHGDEYAMLVQCTHWAYDNTRLSSFFDDFHTAINAISPPKVAVEDAESRKEAVAQDLMERGRKQLETALNAVEVPDEDHERILSKYGTEWKIKEAETRVIGVRPRDSMWLWTATITGRSGRMRRWKRQRRATAKTVS